MTDKLVELTTEIAASYVTNNRVPLTDLEGLIKSIYLSLSTVSEEPGVIEELPLATPSQIKKSITPDALVSFIDGKKYRTLKRHLTSNGFTFASYRARFGLPDSYPTVAPSYSAARSEMAKSKGLGRKPVAAVETLPVATVKATAKKAGVRRPRATKA